MCGHVSLREEGDIELGMASRVFDSARVCNLSRADRPDVQGALMDPAYDCIDHTTRYVTVKYQGVNKVVPEAGFTRFAYVVENR